MKYLGTWWNDRDIELYKINDRNIALYGWNGEAYYDCFEVSEDLHEIIKQGIVVEPIYEEWITEDDEFYDIVDYEIVEG